MCPIFQGANGSNSWEESSLSSSISNHNSDHHTSVNHYHRLSNTDSGIVSTRSSSYSQQSCFSSQFTNVLKHTNNVSENLEQSVHRSFENQMSIKNFHQTTCSNNSLLVLNNSCSSSTSGKDQIDFANNEVPPAIPQKTKRKTERHPSPYDNVPEEKLGKRYFVSKMKNA